MKTIGGLKCDLLVIRIFPQSFCCTVNTNTCGNTNSNTNSTISIIT